jgi:hypothetical protein
MSKNIILVLKVLPWRVLRFHVGIRLLSLRKATKTLNQKSVSFSRVQSSTPPDHEADGLTITPQFLVSRCELRISSNLFRFRNRKYKRVSETVSSFLSIRGVPDAEEQFLIRQVFFFFPLDVTVKDYIREQIVTCYDTGVRRLQVILTPTCRVSGYPRQVIKVAMLLRQLRFIWTALPTVMTLITIIPLGTYNTSSCLLEFLLTGLLLSLDCFLFSSASFYYCPSFYYCRPFTDCSPFITLDSLDRRHHVRLFRCCFNGLIVPLSDFLGNGLL